MRVRGRKECELSLVQGCKGDTDEQTEQNKSRWERWKKRTKRDTKVFIEKGVTTWLKWEWAKHDRQLAVERGIRGAWRVARPLEKKTALSNGVRRKICCVCRLELKMQESPMPKCSTGIMIQSFLSKDPPSYTLKQSIFRIQKNSRSLAKGRP